MQYLLWTIVRISQSYSYFFECVKDTLLRNPFYMLENCKLLNISDYLEEITQTLDSFSQLNKTESHKSREKVELRCKQRDE